MLRRIVIIGAGIALAAVSHNRSEPCRESKILNIFVKYLPLPKRVRELLSVFGSSSLSHHHHSHRPLRRFRLFPFPRARPLLAVQSVPFFSPFLYGRDRH